MGADHIDGLGRLLAALGLGRYEAVLRANDVDVDALHHLTDDDLRELGLSLGHRRKLLAALRRMVDTLSVEGAPAVRAAARLELSEAERRPITAMFCDVVGSTALTVALDPEDMRNLLRQYQDVCAGVVERFGGFIARFMGDGVLAYFGYPRAHENAAEQAVRAGLQIIDEVAQLRGPGNLTPQVRIGIATGLVIIGETPNVGAAREHSATGPAVNVAALLQQVACPNGIVIGGGTQRLLGRLFEVEDLGPQRLKGIPDPVPAWRVLGERSADSRFQALHPSALTDIVGRGAELDMLVDRWKQAKAGEGQVVLLSGEPGIGKSRICQALRERIAQAPHTLIGWHCSPFHTNSVLHPVIGYLARAAGFAPGDPPRAKLRKLEDMLAARNQRDDSSIALFAALLSIDGHEARRRGSLAPEQQKQRALEALADHVATIAHVEPVLLLVEDAHWIDPTTFEFMGLCIDRLRWAPVLILVTFRPEFRHGWGGHSHVTTLAPSRLEPRESARLIEQLTAGKKLPPEVVDRIIAKTDGVPLFIEELTKTVVESGVLREEDDRYVLAEPLPARAIPATLHDSLRARLDRLAAVKKVAQIGAAIGREFSYELLAAVVRRADGDLQKAVAQLVDAELVQQRGAPPDAVYVFKHALVQDAAYESLLRDERGPLHARIAERLTRRFPDLIERQPELLAHHLTEAGLAGKAIEQWLKAGQRAADRSANLEAVGHLTRGLQLLGALPDERSRMRHEMLLQTALGMPLIATKGYAAKETSAAWSRAHHLAERLGDEENLFTALYGEWAVHIVGGQCRPGLEIAEKMAQVARAAGDRAKLLVSDRIIGVSHHCLGDQAFGRAAIESALAHYDPDSDRLLALRFGQDQRVAALAFRSVILWVQGFPEQARQLSLECLARGREIDHANSLGYALGWGACTVAALGRDVAETQRLAAALIEHAEQNAQFWNGYGLAYGGWVMAELGEPDGPARLREAITALRESGGLLRIPEHLAALARVLGKVGRPDEGLSVIEEALAQVERSEERWHEAELLRLQAALLLTFHGERAQAMAEELLLRSLKIAARQGARAWQLRSAAALASLWRSHGREADARALLAPIYGAYTEGFDTPDLRVAKALLDGVEDAVSPASRRL
jgi:class 3 adenylate cyclase